MSHSHDPISNKPRPKADYTDQEVQLKPVLLFFFYTAIFCIAGMVPDAAGVMAHFDRT